MKLTSVNKSFLLVLLISPIACKYQSEKELLAGTWVYTEILKNEQVHVSVSDEDKMNLDLSTGKFSYAVASLNKNKQGHWTYAHDTLQLNYQDPDSVRFFKVDLLSHSKLIMHENNLVFSFKRDR